MVTANTICMGVLQMSEELEQAQQRVKDLDNDAILLQDRLGELSEENKRLRVQTGHLSLVLLNEFGGPKGDDGGAVDMAIRLLRELREENKGLCVQIGNLSDRSSKSNAQELTHCFRASARPLPNHRLMEVYVSYNNSGSECSAGTLHVPTGDADAMCAAIRGVPVSQNA